MTDNITVEKDAAFEETLNKIAKENGYKDYKLQITRVNSGGANYSSHLYSGKISEPKKPDINWFAKVSISTTSLREEIPLEFYKLEHYAYTTLLKIFEDLENRFNVPQEYRFLKPKLFGHRSTDDREMIVLQDLAAEGFKSHDRCESFQWPYASAAVQQLAILHALSFAFRHYHPKEYKCFADKFGEDDMNMFLKAAEGPIKANTVLIKQENRERLDKYLKKLPEVLCNMRKPWKIPVVAHGDYRMSNLMHKTEENGKVSLIVIDYQTYHIGSPVNDLIYFIVSGSDAEFRKKHYRQLLDHYYDELSQALVRLQLDPEQVYSREDYEYELKEYTKNGLLFSLFVVPIVTVDFENVPNMDSEDLELDDIMQMKASELGVQRLNEIVQDYIDWGEI